MGRRVRRASQEQVLIDTWWVRTVVALAFIGLAYGFVSIAFDSGNLWEYIVGLIFLWYGAKHAVRAVRFGLFS